MSSGKVLPLAVKSPRGRPQPTGDVEGPEGLASVLTVKEGTGCVSVTCSGRAGPCLVGRAPPLATACPFQPWRGGSHRQEVKGGRGARLGLQAVAERREVCLEVPVAT